MATNTSRLGLLKKDTTTDGNDTFNIKTMLNDNWDLIDAKVATLGADGKVPAEQLSISVSDASTTQKGVVMLEDSVSSTSITKAATPNSVKTVSDALDAHKTDLASHGVYGTATGTNALTMSVALDSSVTSYPTFMLVAFKNTTANTGATTLNINSLGAKPIKKSNGNDLSSGSLKAGGVYQLRYDGSNFILLGEGGDYGTATASQVLQGYTLGTENGVVSGSYIPTSVKSIQRGTVILAVGTLSTDVSISSININNTIVKITKKATTSSTDTTNVNAAAILTGSTTIKLEREAGSLTALEISWEVIEFISVKSLQSGVTVSDTQSTTVNITSVNANKALIFLSYKTNSNGNTSTEGLLATLNTNSIIFNQTLSGYSKTVAWQVIEFN